MPLWRDQQAQGRKEEIEYQKREQRLAALTLQYSNPPMEEQAIILGAVIDKRHQKGIEAGGRIVRDPYGGEWFSLFIDKPRHIVLEGVSGSGKTELLKLLIRQYLARGKQIVVVDGAGNPEFAQAVCVMADEANVGPVPVVKYPETLGLSAVFNGFIGGNGSIYNRLIAMLNADDEGTDGDHWRETRRIILGLICGINVKKMYGIDPLEPPRSFQQLSDWLTEEELLKNFGKSPKAKAKINRYKSILAELQDKVDGRIAPLTHLLDEEGFTLGDHPVTHFQINRGDGGHVAEYLFRFLTECFKTMMGQAGHNLVVVIDEFGLFDSETIALLIKYGRQKGVQFVLSLQVVESIKEDNFIKEILGNTPVKILMRGDLPEEMIRRAGTYKQPDRSHSFDGDGLSRGTTYREKEVNKIDLEEVQNLKDGEAFVRINGGVVRIQAPEMRLKTRFSESMEDQSVREDIIELLKANQTQQSNTQQVPPAQNARKTSQEKRLF